MIDDYYVKPASREEIEEKAYAWRQAFGITAHCAAPDMVSVLELELPKLLPQVSIVVEKDTVLDDIEAYTQYDPPLIVLRQGVYYSAVRSDGRARMTLAHELGHLLLHKSAAPLHRAPAKYRSMEGLKPFASAEYQAKVFASAFLMPEWIVCSFSDPIELSQHCAVSIKAATIRLNQVKVKPRPQLPEIVAQTIDEF